MNSFFSPIRSLPGSKKQFPNVQSKIDCRLKRQVIPSVPAEFVKMSIKDVKTKEQAVSLPSFTKVCQQPFRASPVPRSNYSQPFRPVLARKSALPSRVVVKRVDANKADYYAVDEVVAAEAVEAVPIEQVAEKAILAGESVDDEAVATADALEAIPIEQVVAEETIPADKAVEEVLLAAEAVKIVAVDDAVEEVIFAPMALEAAPVEEAVHVPHLDVFTTEAIVTHEASGTEKRKKRYRKKKSSASRVTSSPVVSVEAKPEAVEESAATELTKKQRQNIHTNRKRSAAWKALRQTLGPDAHIYIPSRHVAAKNLAAKEVAFDVLSDTPKA